MSKRELKRFARRLQVRFWQRGSDEAFTAYTTNISASGMFIGTVSPLKPGTRVRIELIADPHGFFVEGLVVHAAKVSPLLRKLRESGMGVRFLTMSELVKEILPTADLEQRDSGAAQRAAEDAGEAGPGGTEKETAGAAGEAGADAGNAPLRETGGEEAGDREAAAPEPRDAEAAGAPPLDRDTQPLELEPEQIYTLRFPSLPHFLSVFERDIASGGIFVPTPEPDSADHRVTIRIEIPAPVDRQMQAPARVIRRLSPESADDNLLAGFGAEFIDPEAVVAEIRRLIYDG